VSVCARARVRPSARTCSHIVHPQTAPLWHYSSSIYGLPRFVPAWGRSKCLDVTGFSQHGGACVQVCSNIGDPHLSIHQPGSHVPYAIAGATIGLDTDALKTAYGAAADPAAVLSGTTPVPASLEGNLAPVLAVLDEIHATPVPVGVCRSGVLAIYVSVRRLFARHPFRPFVMSPCQCPLIRRAFDLCVCVCVRVSHPFARLFVCHLPLLPAADPAPATPDTAATESLGAHSCAGWCSVLGDTSRSPC
jgi:hypothetical protein